MTDDIIVEPVKINSRSTVHQCGDLTIVNEEVTFHNGFDASIGLIEHPDASAVVALTSNNEIVLVRQYRHSVRDYIWEIPSGTSNNNEIPIQCAKRELQEETGYLARSWRSLGYMMPMPELTSVKINLFLARDIELTHQHLDDDEIIEVDFFNTANIEKMICEGAIRDGKTIYGFFIARQWLKKWDTAGLQS